MQFATMASQIDRVVELPRDVAGRELRAADGMRTIALGHPDRAGLARELRGEARDRTGERDEGLSDEDDFGGFDRALDAGGG
jgi:hypothetical protein